MNWFLIVLGGLVGSVLGLVIVGVGLWFGLKWWISRKISGMVDGVKGMMQAADCVQPFRLTLHPGLDEEWNVAGAADLIADLKQNGFVEVGDFHTEESPTFCFSVKGFACVEQNLWAALYHHAQAGFWIDVVSFGVDKTTLTISTLADHGMDSPDYAQVEFQPQADVRTVLQRMGALRQVSQHQAQPVVPTQFQTVFCQAYERSLDWRIGRGGPTEEEILRQADRSGVKEPQRQQLVQLVQMQWRTRISEFYEKQLAERFVEASNLSPGKWAKMRHRVLFVYDQLSGHDLTTRCSNLLIPLVRGHSSGAEDDEEEEFDNDEYDDGLGKFLESVAEVAATGPARQVFPQIIETLADQFTFTKVGSLKKPVPADVYSVERTKPTSPRLGFAEE